MDERLEQELGLKREREEAANNGGLTKLATGLPTTIPTYDSLGLPATKVGGFTENVDPRTVNEMWSVYIDQNYHQFEKVYKELT